MRSSRSILHASDAATSERLWTYDPEVYRGDLRRDGVTAAGYVAAS